MPRANNSDHLVIGHYGGHNTGDEAMLAGLLSASSDFLPNGAVVVRRGGKAGLEGYAVRTVEPTAWAVLRSLSRSHGLVLGGGTHFHDDYRLPRYLRHLRYLSRILLLSLLARLSGRYVLWLGMGFGPFHRAPTRWLTRIGLGLCDFVTVRDAASRRAVNGWIRPDRLEVGFDLAALVEFTAPSPAPRPGRVLGISTSTATTSHGRSRANDERFWQEFDQTIIARFERDEDLRVRIFVFRGGAREDDVDRSADLRERLSAIDSARVDLVDFSPDPRLALRAAATCTSFVATRYHSAIFAYLAGCALMCVPYHRKVVDLAAELGLDPVSLAEPRPGSKAELARKLDALLAGERAFRPNLPQDEAVRRAKTSIKAWRRVVQANSG